MHSLKKLSGGPKISFCTERSAGSGRRPSACLHERLSAVGKASRIARLFAVVLARRPQHPRLRLRLRLRLLLRQRQHQHQRQHLPRQHSAWRVEVTLHSSPPPTDGATPTFMETGGITSSRKRGRHRSRHRRHRRLLWPPAPHGRQLHVEQRQIRSSSYPPSSRPWTRRLVWAHFLQRCMSRPDESWHDGPNNGARQALAGGSRSALLGTGARARCGVQ